MWHRKKIWNLVGIIQVLDEKKSTNTIGDFNEFISIFEKRKSFKFPNWDHLFPKLYTKYPYRNSGIQWVLYMVSRTLEKQTRPMLDQHGMNLWIFESLPHSSQQKCVGSLPTLSVFHGHYLGAKAFQILELLDLSPRIPARNTFTKHGLPPQTYPSMKNWNF